jgi:hypothetical protein
MPPDRVSVVAEAPPNLVLGLDGEGLDRQTAVLLEPLATQRLVLVVLEENCGSDVASNLNGDARVWMRTKHHRPLNHCPNQTTRMRRT